MNQVAIKAILDGLSFEELETTITEAQKYAARIAEDDLYNFERPAYSYWASGGGGFGFKTPGERIAWNRKRDRLTERARKYSQRARLTIQPPAPPAPAVGWLLFNGIGIGAAIASGIWLALFLYLAYGR